MIQVEWGWMASGTLSLPEEDLLPAHFAWGRSGRIQAAKWVEFGRGWEIKHILYLCHMGHLYAWNDREPFLHGMDRVTVKIRGAKLKLGKILHGTEAALRAVDLLVEQAAEA